MVSRVMILTGDAGDAQALGEVLSNTQDEPYAVEWVKRLSDALPRLEAGDVDALLVDLALPDSHGIDTFDQLFATAPQVPILTLCGVEDEGLASLAVARGAEGYLSKDYFDSYLVAQSLRNIIQRKVVEEGVFSDQLRAEVTLNSISDAVIGTDMQGNVDYLNVAAETMTGWSREEARGQPISVVMRIINGATRAIRPNPIELVLQQDAPLKLAVDTVLLHRDGSERAIEDSAAPIHDANGQLSGAVIVFHDVTEGQVMALKMSHLAQHDFLTNLPNRVLLNDRIGQAIALAERRGQHLAVLFLDLDNFKQINDSLGHSIGDQLLQSVAQRLCASVRRSDTVSRQGGDEFVLLLAQDKYAEDAALTAEKILTALAAVHRLEGHELLVTASIGISSYPGDALNAETLIKHADTAMYQAKELGRNTYQFFTPDMNNQAIERQLIENQLRHALGRNEFILHYQPKVNLRSGVITGIEALLRWNHPQLGLLLPSRFVAIAEDCGLLVEIGHWVLQEACNQAQRWRAAGLRFASMAVNICAGEFRHPQFVAAVSAALQASGLNACDLQLEICESALVRETELSGVILTQLSALGVPLAVDEFGRGYSSLSQLTQFPISVLKIDQSFVQKLDAPGDDRLIVSALLAMGNSLKQRLVAVGIESHEQLVFLQAQHCEEGQGYLFSPPLAARQLALLLARGRIELP
ncbi:MAG: two-component system response regulator [Pseudomonadales bacterium RIFCSPLOWO2_12_59_9]|nr:MAG: two-component system response regulator [Pseudomonadales bacterium RIFCSPLOWO2_12_59_9]